MDETIPPARSARRYDLLAALVATFVSVLALFVSGYSTYWQRQQTRAMTWPRLVQSYNLERNDAGSTYSIEFANSGTGLLDVQTMVVSLNGVPVHSPSDLIQKLGQWRNIMPGADRKELLHIGLSTFSTLGAGEKVRLLNATDKVLCAALGAGIIESKHHITVRTCYCSLLDECWTTDGDETRPTPVARCPNEPNNFLSSEIIPNKEHP